jgi:hypothetical protein
MGMARKACALVVLAALASCSPPQSSAPNVFGLFPAWQTLSGAHFEHWSGIQYHADENAAALSSSGEAIFQYPDGAKGWVRHGFRSSNDGAADWHEAYGLQLEIKQDGDAPRTLRALIATPGETDESRMVACSVPVQGPGWQRITLPWSVFDFGHADPSFLQNVKQLRLALTAGSALVRNVRVIDGDPLSLRCDVRGKSAGPGNAIDYQVDVRNCSLLPQTAELSFQRQGWEIMRPSVTPDAISLKPGEDQVCTVRVNVPEDLAPGGHEEQVLQAVASGRGTSTLTLLTARALPHPYILHTAAQWQEVRDNVKKYAWAKTEQDKILAEANAWTVPEIAQPPQNDPHDNYGPFLFATTNEHGLMACGIAYQLTGDKTYADKVALFLRRLSDPQQGYPKTFRACNQSFVQEGHFTQHIAMAYDMIYDSGALSDGDKQQLDATLRLLMETIRLGNVGAYISNWNLSELCGAFYAALMLQDLSAADGFFSGIKTELAKGVMDDGWWYECSVSYNTWCTTEFSQVALAWQPWGVNFKDQWVPASYSRDVELSLTAHKDADAPADTGNKPDRPFGMSKDLAGPHTKPYRSIRQMWDSLPSFIDWRGVMFGVNDSSERRPVDGENTYDIAYYLYRDPVYAAMEKLEKERSLLYSVNDLPTQTPDVSSYSACADNAGIAMLRSQTPGRPQAERIQATLHYGTHGWAHGHFDLTDLLSLMRYGRSFYNPEMIWYGYPAFMYKFYVQASVNHNMVLVDQKMQEAADSTRLLFSTGKLLQAAAVETTTRWSNPPYGGMVYDYVPVKNFAEKCWLEGRDVPIPANPPAYGSLTDFTEPILQRRLLIVTDDYIIVADYLKAQQKHTFDNVLQLTGFQGLDAARKTLLRHDAQWNPDPVGSAQFVTDCDWYSAQAPAVGRFAMSWKSDKDPKKTVAPTLCSEDGVLKMDVHSLWPHEQQIMIGQSPQVQHNEKKLWYTVRGDGKVSTEGKFGSWILGQADLNVPLNGVKALELETRTEGAAKKTLFWANARVVTADGREIPLASLPVRYENIAQPPAPQKDYYGQPVKIAGQTYDAATPSEPDDESKPGIVRVDLSGLNATALKAVLGGTFPLADGTQLHKVYAIRSEGTEARFLNLIEPYDKQPVVKSAQATSADTIHVELSDGRMQDLTIHNMEGDGKDLSVTLHQSGKGPAADESTQPATP